MTSTSPQTLSTDHSRAVTDGDHSHGVAPQSSRAARHTSFDVADFAQVTGREEDWRFSPVDKLATLFSETLVQSSDGLEISAAPEVQVETVAASDSRRGTVGIPGDRAAAASYSGVSEATIITIPAEVKASRDTRVTITGSGLDGAGHIVIIAGTMSEAVVVLDHQGAGRLNQNVEIRVGDGAQLTVVSVQDWSREAIHLSAQRAVLGRDARLRHIVVTLGGDVIRVTPEAAFAGQGSEVEMLGLYFADAGQHQEHRLFVDHGVPNCRSRVTYKGALQGTDAHTVWVGDVLIRANAEGTDTYELNRNLVLTNGARADSVPNLEIETGEIEGAGHASATGRFDDEQLFYLRSRGIPEDAARRLVVRGFFAELIHQIGVPDVEERLMEAIEAELDRSLA